MQPVIRFENVGKLYRLGTVGTGTISHDLRRWWITSVMRKEDPYLKIGETNDRSTKGSSDYVYALKDINLEVQEGDVLGIIGKNGAGKSTLLKLLSRVTAPTTGKIYTKGRIASLLEVGTGFHPELTGRENIYMNGSILGMKKYEITRKLDEIIDFSGCERYIDTPVKRYSSGMMVRLGFAVAAHLDPEILVVDEVLAVGDAEFQKKAIGKMQDVSKGQGRTVLFVSHNMASVKALCNHSILMENGKIKSTGSTSQIIFNYLNSKNVNISNLVDCKRIGDGKVVFQKMYVTNELGSPIETILTGSNVYFVFEVKANCASTFDLGFSFHNDNDTMISNLYMSYQQISYSVQPGYYTVRCLVKDFPFSSSVLYVGGVIKVDKAISDWPEGYLGKYNVVMGNFYLEKGYSLMDQGLYSLFRGDWNISNN